MNLEQSSWSLRIAPVSDIMEYTSISSVVHWPVVQNPLIAEIFLQNSVQFYKNIKHDFVHYNILGNNERQSLYKGQSS